MSEQVVPYGVITAIFIRFVPHAYNEIKEAYYVKDEYQKLKDTTASINIALLNATAQDRVTQEWIRRLRQVLHSVDYLMDGLNIKFLKHRLNVARKNGWALFVEDVKRPFCSIELNQKIKEIRKSVDYLLKDRSLVSNLISSQVVYRRNKDDNNSAFVESAAVVGLEDDKRKIIEKLRKTQEKNCRVSLLAIVGIGGMGKATVAKSVCNDSEVKSVFTKLIWVTVSHDFKVKTILKKMLKYLKQVDVGDLELPILGKMIKDELSGQKYMLVLEDVWNEAPSDWDALITHLMCGVNGSVILVTTRSKRVAQTISEKENRHIDLHVLEGLTEEQSWALFKKEVTNENVKMSSNFESIREIVVKRCSGVPVAIKTMACYLNYITCEGTSKSRRLEGSEWMKILGGDVWKFYDTKDHNNIMPLLRLSYQNLSYKLQQCFAYCCLYPKGWKIDPEELIQLWMAQGYLEEDKSMSLEDMGNHFINELEMGLFFQEQEDEYGKTYYQMHDLMHDLATSVAGDDYYLDGQGKGNTGTPMHISFLSGCDVQSLGSLKGSKPKTILGHKIINDEILATLHTKTELKYVLALDLSNTSITKVPDFIRECKRLKYLDLSNCAQLTSLPKWLKYRILLQTLKINGCPKLVCSGKEIKKLIADLKSLKYLYIDESKDPYVTGDSVEDEKETRPLLHDTKKEEARAKIFSIPNKH